MSTRPPRRPRYRGTHPRRFEEKYKELAPERFPDEIEKVRGRGGTPAGAHVPVLLAETLAALAPRPGEIALDVTLGHGGHAVALAERVAPGGRVIGLDRDGDEIARTRERLADLALPIEAHHESFAGAAKVLKALAIEAIDVVLADLGASSMQLDRPERGFSFKHDGPLDMRMDRSRGATAAEWLERTDEATLAAALAEHGDEEHAVAIAAAIKAAPPGSLVNTRELAALVLRATQNPGWRRTDPHELHPAARTFQALRIVVNREDEQLAALLRDLPWLLRPSGRAAVITFHSGERRRVEVAFAEGRAAGWYEPDDHAALISPTPDEVHANPRARSARLHFVIRSR